MGMAGLARIVVPCFVALSWAFILHSAGHLYNGVNTLTANTGSSMMFEQPEGDKNMALLKKMAGSDPQAKKILFLLTGMIMRSEAWMVFGMAMSGMAAMLLPLEYRFPAFGVQTVSFGAMAVVHTLHKLEIFPMGVEMFNGPHVTGWASDYMVHDALMVLMCGGCAIDSLMASRKAKAPKRA